MVPLIIVLGLAFVIVVVAIYENDKKKQRNAPEEQLPALRAKADALGWKIKWEREDAFPVEVTGGSFVAQIAEDNGSDFYELHLIWELPKKAQRFSLCSKRQEKLPEEWAQALSSLDMSEAVELPSSQFATRYAMWKLEDYFLFMGHQAFAHRQWDDRLFMSYSVQELAYQKLQGILWSSDPFVVSASYAKDAHLALTALDFLAIDGGKIYIKTSLRYPCSLLPAFLSFCDEIEQRLMLWQKQPHKQVTLQISALLEQHQLSDVMDDESLRGTNSDVSMYLGRWLTFAQEHDAKMLGTVVELLLKSGQESLMKLSLPYMTKGSSGLLRNMIQQIQFDTSVRRELLETLVSLDPSEGTRHALVKVAFDPRNTEELKRQALEAWAATYEASDVPVLVKQLGETNKARQQAILHLVRLHGTPAQEPGLLKHLKAFSTEGKVLAVEVLGKIGTRPSMMRLDELLESDDATLRKAAKKAMLSIKERLLKGEGAEALGGLSMSGPEGQSGSLSVADTAEVGGISLTDTEEA